MSQNVQVRVEEIRSAGIIVSIPTEGRKGFVPRRELSWNRSVRNAPIEPAVGEVLNAVRLPSAHRDGYVMLSFRLTTNPWKGVSARYASGETVRGEVVNLRQNAAYVQVEPGIDGVIWSRDLPLKSGQIPNEVLEVGDRVLAVVTVVDEESKRLELSLMEYLRQLPQEAEERNAVQSEMVHCLPSEAPLSTTESESSTRVQAPQHHMPLPNFERILVVDDNPGDLGLTIRWLQDTYGVDIDAADSASRAVELVKQGNRYSLAVIDVRLGNHHGGRIAEDIFDIDNEIAFVFVSSDPHAEYDIGLIGGRRWPFTIKQHDSVIDCIDKVIHGYSEGVFSQQHKGYVGQGGFLEQLAVSSRLRRPLAEVLTDILRQLRDETNVTYAMVISTRQSERSASILACVPALSVDVQRLSEDGLYYSPVRQAAEFGETVHASYVQQDEEPRFRNFFPLLPFSSCLGIPLTSPGLATGYALFLLDEDSEEISQQVRTKVQLAIPFLETAVERAELFEVMRNYEQRYTQGQLLGSLTHELHAKLRGMDAQVQRLEGMLAQLELPLQPPARKNYLLKASDATSKLRDTRSKMVELIEAYSRLVRGEFEAVDVNKVVKKALSQLSQYASDSEVDLFTQLEHAIPQAEAIDSRLEQIVMNLVLNAIQQIRRQRDFFRGLDSRHTHAWAGDTFVPVGLVTVRTCHRSDDPRYPIKIIVSDTGPGVHYSLERRLFHLNTSTRASGQGLGLYISRNLTDFMAGRLKLADSILFVGSAFVLELRQHT
ncbi:MAG TPA: S1 RNA-binding domain-containing protein [Anaerolineae bacterium]|nr:S1 RNA-binding domain-containing protein [Anaerolineae bacterium]